MMRITALALSALSLSSLTGAQNGNDALILNNRTGLAPVVYDTFSTSYTTTNEPIRNSISVPVTPSPVRSNTFLPKPNTSVECWRNGYPCGQNGGQRSQRRVAMFARATPVIDKIAHRVPPPEFFSTRLGVQLPDETGAPGETGEISMGIHPIPTSLTGETQDSIPEPDKIKVPEETGDVSVGILPIPTSFAGDKQYDAPSQPSKTGDSIFSILPISTEWWRSPDHTVLPNAPDSIFRPIQQHSSFVSIPSGFPSMQTIVASVSIDSCFRHYCPSRRVKSTEVLPTPTSILTTTKPVVTEEPVPSALPAVPPNASTASA